MKTPKVFLFTLCFIITVYANSQTITKTTASNVIGTVCPVSGTGYSVSIPGNFGSCKIKWTVTNGVINGSDNLRTVGVTWNDVRGVTSIIKVTFSGCAQGNPNEGLYDTKSELILSVKDRPFDFFSNNLINLDFCNPPQSIPITVPEMIVEGTGGFNQPARTEVSYLWNLPAGWKDFTTGKTGEFGTTSRSITIVPLACAEPGVITVKGSLRGSTSGCLSSAFSSAINISLNSASPIVTVVPQSGYAGSTSCNITPVTFTAVVTNAPSCTNSSYQWILPDNSSWSLESQTGNTASLIPSGSPADAAGIKVKVTFGCGSFREGTFTPEFNAPVILGSTPVCSSATYTVGNAQGLQIGWASSNTAIATINSSGLLTRVGIERGAVTVSATLPCSVPVAPKPIWVGKPVLTSVTYDGIPTPINCSSGLYQSFTPGDHVLTSTALGTTSNPAFILNSYGSPYVHGGANGNNYNFNVNSKHYNDFEFTISSSFSNGCGSISTCTYFTNWATLTSPFPNPSANEFRLQLDENTELKSVLIYNSKQEQVFSSNTKEKEMIIETTSLPDGVYVVKVVSGRKVTSHQLLVRH